VTDRACPLEFIHFAERLALAAGEVALTHFRSAFAVEWKADNSPVTLADRGAEERMRTMVAARYPAHGIIGEEFGSDRPGADDVWVFDPIDGTRAFVTGSPQFGNLIALLRDGRPILGIINMAALNETWIGATGWPTLYRQAQREETVRSRACPDLSLATLRTHSPDHFGEALSAYNRLKSAVRETHFGGDCFAFGQIANGWIDLVVDSGLGVYDFMPLVPVVEGAGGRMTDFEGQPLTLESPGAIAAAGDPALHRRVVDMMGER